MSGEKLLRLEQPHGLGDIFVAWQRGPGNYFATRGCDSAVKVFDIFGQLITTINLQGFSCDFAWNSDGELLAVINKKSSQLLLWDANHDKQQFIDMGIRDTFRCLFWSKTAPILAICTSKGNLSIYNHSTNTCVPIIGKHKKSITCGAWNTENLLALGSDDKTLSISNVDGDTIRTISLKSEPADIQFSEILNERVGGENIVSVIVGKRTLFLYNLLDPENPIEFAFQQHFGHIVTYKWFGDGHILLGFSAGYFSAISTQNKEVGRELFQFRNHKNLVDVAISFSINKVASCGDNTVKIYDISNLQETSSVITLSQETILDRIGWNEDGQLLAVCTHEGSVNVYLSQLPTGGQLPQLTFSTHDGFKQTVSNQEVAKTNLNKHRHMLHRSNEEFEREYKKLYCGKAEAEELYLLVLTKLEKAISDGNVDNFKKLRNFIGFISSIEDQIALGKYYKNANNPIKNTNIVISACKHNKVKILEYLFGIDSKLLKNLSIDIGRTVLPSNEDAACHNAFYYAIRSGNVELLDTLINKWPNNYFAAHLGELDDILSIAYEELQLKNVSLSNEMYIFVESKLINYRFFSNTSKRGQSFTIDINNIRERIGLILQNIRLLNAEYSNTEKVDKKFLFIAKFIAQNLHVLKRQLKSTYNRLPWEEMEFCLVSFVSSYTKRQEINLFYNANLNKGKILNYLQNFAEMLENEKKIVEGVNIGKLDEIPKLKREEVVAEIISNYPQFEKLYYDYQQIRDIYSLEKISDSIKLALSTDPKEREGQLIIIRVLQAIGEHLKNTLESPKLSNTVSELFLLSLPKNTRQVVIDLRNSLSHACSLSKRTEIEGNTDINFFIGLQNDIKKVGNVVTDILFDNKIKMIRKLLEKLVSSKNVDEIKEFETLFNNVDVRINNMISERFTIMENEKLDKLVKKLCDNITDQTLYEKELFNKINNIIHFEKTQSINITTDYYTGFLLLQSLSVQLSDSKIDHNGIRVMKYFAKKTLENIAPRIESYNLKEIAELSRKIKHSVTRRQHGNFDEIKRLIFEIFYITEFGIDDIKWIEAFRIKLNEKGSFIRLHPRKRTCKVSEQKHNKQLALKLSNLESVLSKNGLLDQFIDKFPSYKKNKQLQAVIEMYVLDIMSILDSSYLENNLLFLDNNAPLLIGKSLRNHLAHDNALVDILLSDPLAAVLLNAKKLTEKSMMSGKKKIGQLVRDDLFKLRDKFNQGVEVIINQERMLAALEEGNIEDVKSCLKKGVDINARSINSWTTLHFAAKGPSLDVIKFILDQNLDVHAKNGNSQNSLHVAAAHGRKNIVEFLVKKTDLYVDELDNNGSTPLLIAAQNGHKDTVEILLKNNAKTNTLNIFGFSPLHCAIRNNYIDIVKILLKKEVNADINETLGGFTSLHVAAEMGHLEIVNFLLRNKANVNARNDKQGIPLHTAALNGHVEVVNALVFKGADVNARVVNGCTPLHYAVENGHENIANILLKYGANANAFDKIYNNTPLHYAAKDGHEEIVKILLKNEANAGVATVEGITPLHFAAGGGHLEIVADFIKHGVNIHAEDKNNATPLHHAAEGGHKKVAELLIKNKARVNSKANNNFTPLYVAVKNGHKDVVDLLIKNKAQVNAYDIQNNTPLHAAAMQGNIDMIDLLIKNKADVNARTQNGLTPLHAAVANGHEDAIHFLMKSKAEVNTIANYSFTPLHAAIMGGYKDIVNLLIKNKADVNAEGIAVHALPLHVAVEADNKEVVEILIANGANINAKNKNNVTPLSSAVKHNFKEIVEVLIANGANVNEEGNAPLFLAVVGGYRDIVKILLKNKAHVNMKNSEDITPLHLAAGRGNKEMVNDLLTRGADVDARDDKNITPLGFAAFEGNEETAEILIANGASVNITFYENVTPLYMAAIKGHSNVVKVLLNNEANANIKDHKNRTPLELAVLHGHLEVVKMFVQYKKVAINAKNNDDWTILHIASQGGNLEIVKLLTNEGSDINTKNASGSKPIHIAAREGHNDIVKFFLHKGLSINDPGAVNQTLLHYAAINGHLEVLKDLVTQGADVNAKDDNGVTPMHITAKFGYKDVIKFLLKNGAIYNAVDKCFRKPLDMTNDKSVINVLASTKKLFEAVKYNVCSKITDCIEAGAFVNVQNADNGTPLHYAAWKGNEEVVNILLQNKANPNAAGNKGFTPLHYAAKFSHLKIVNSLLFNGAVYNAVSDSGTTPLDLTDDKSITDLFKLLSQLFKNVKNGNSNVIIELNRINNVDTIKAVMGACNRENRTLIVAAMHSKFSKVEQLKQISQGDISTEINTALVLLNQGNYQKSWRILERSFEKRKEILGPDNPGTLDIQTNMAKVLYKQGAYQEALNMLEEIFQKQKRMFGLNGEITLSTRSIIAVVLHRQGKNEEAFNIYQEVYQKQKEILGPNHFDTLNTQFHMALVLHSQEKYEEALNINRVVFEKRKIIFGINDINTVYAQNNVAMVLASQDKYEEALKIYQDVIEKKKMILGSHHSDTLRTLNNIAGIIFKQNKHNEALNAFQEIFNIQKNVLGENHPETLNTQYNLANVIFAQGKWISALKAYIKCFDQRKAAFGPNHPSVLDISSKLEMINRRFKLEGDKPSEILQCLQKELNIATSNGDTPTIQRLLKDGADINDKDIEGRTPLHYAVSNGYIDIVNILLKNGADVTQVTNKGNTPLHTATSKSYKEIIEVLLQHISHDKLNGFINAKTAYGGTTSLHVAAKSGYLEVVKSLLKHGATYNIENKEGKTPINLSKDQKVINLLKLIEEFFRDTNNGNVEIISKLSAVKHDEFSAITNTRNQQGNTLLQVAIVNKHKLIVSKLLAMLKKPN